MDVDRPHPPSELAVAETAAAKATKARRLFREFILDIRSDVRPPVDDIGAVDDEQQLLLAGYVGGRALRLVDERLEQLVLFVGDRLIELLVDLLLIGSRSSPARASARRALAASSRTGSSGRSPF